MYDCEACLAALRGRVAEMVSNELAIKGTSAEVVESLPADREGAYAIATPYASFDVAKLQAGVDDLVSWCCECATALAKHIPDGAIITTPEVCSVREFFMLRVWLAVDVVPPRPQPKTEE